MAFARRLILSAVTILGMTLPAAAADAIKAPVKSAAADRCAKIEPLPGTPDLPGGTIFGFTDSSDPSTPCAWDFGSENDFRWGKRDGRYFAASSKTEFSYGVTRNVAFTMAIFTTYHRWADVTSVRDALSSQGDGVLLDRLSQANFDGASAELFVRLVERAPGQRFGVAVAVEPRWSRVDGTSGYRAEGYGAEFKFMVDAVVTERLFAALNLNYSLNAQRFNIPNATWERGSATNVSAALVAQLYAAEKQPIEGIFLGAEARHRSQFSGLTLERMTGHAFNLGPTFAVLFPGERILNLAWSPQLAGKAREPSAPGPLDLDNFERHEFRAKFATPIGP
jgi:hypothetical protein